jgi:hypothetical protein
MGLHATIHLPYKPNILSVVYSVILAVCVPTQSWMMVNDELECMLKEVVIPNLPGTEENHKKLCYNSIHAKI